MAYAPYWTTLATPVGTVIVRGTADAVTSISVCAQGEAGPASRDMPADSPVMVAAEQIRDYFEGHRRIFDVPLAPASTARGGALRAAIAAVPYGECVTYGDLARRHASAARAVGQACARNPFPIIIPCHRVTSSRHAPEHYSAGNGLETKSWLITHEARTSGKALK